MSLSKDKGKIVKYGGGVLKVREVTDAGGTPGAVSDLGYVQDTEFFSNVSEEKLTDETGNPIRTLYNDIQEGMKTTLLQTDKDTIDFLKAAGTKYYGVYYKATKTAEMNGKTQELFAGIAQIKPMFSIKAGAKKIPVEINFNICEAQIDLSGLTSAFGSAADTATIAINTSYVIVETA